MKHLGNVTDINGGKIAPVDIISFGSPCQDLSVAGKRAGLEGERSGLFNEAVRIIREMQSATAGKYPRLAIWENVPGAFSSNRGGDFAAVLESLVGTKVSIPKEGWTRAGVVFGPEGQAAWRVLDAQYWGVPQRRDRIFLVADFRGECAGEILFEPEGLPWDTTESGEAREGIAGSVGDGVEGAGETWAIRTAQTSSNGWGITKELSYTIDLASGQAVAQPIAFNGRQDPVYGKVTGALDTDRATQCVAVHPHVTGTLCASGAGMSRPAGMASETDLLVAQCVTTGTGRRYDPESETLIPVAFQPGNLSRQAGAEPSTKVFPTLGATTLGDQFPCVAYDPKDLGRRPATFEDVSPTLKARCGTGGNNIPVTQIGYRVRRLTPLECERLQGFPDGWTDIPGGSDTARYKALGNSVAIPCVSFIMRRIKEVLGLKTLGSLFDGIAGFPLAAQRHGIRTLWASEIEPFCIRVSSSHFPEVAQ